MKTDQSKVALKEPKVVKAPSVEAKQVKYVEVVDYGDSIIEKLNFTFSCVIQKVYFLITLFDLRVNVLALSVSNVERFRAGDNKKAER